MLNEMEIRKGLIEVATCFPVKKIAYFGSYAEGVATEQSDLDVLVEFNEKAVSLLKIIEIKYQLEETLGVPVDVIHSPIPDGSLIRPGKVVSVYAV
jgi:predicted nucleotidyltransferase